MINDVKVGDVLVHKCGNWEIFIKNISGQIVQTIILSNRTVDPSSVGDFWQTDIQTLKDYWHQKKNLCPRCDDIIYKKIFKGKK